MYRFKKIIGYVAQDDIVLPELTVRENILHSARIRLPTSWNEGQIQKHVDDIIICLGLAHVQHSQVGDTVKPVISGGQRKRVSIGIELAAAPMVLVLDEPTSGLDATSALSIIEILKELSRLGITVVCIIHQPRLEIFQSLDRLLLLTAGREIYFAEAADAVSYFKEAGFVIPAHHNPADVLLDIISGHGHRYAQNGLATSELTVARLVSRWEETKKLRTERSSNPTLKQADLLQTVLHSVRNRGASWVRQAYFCFCRSLKQQTRQLSGFLLEISVGAIAGLLIGLSVYRLDGLLFQGVFTSPFEPLSSAVNYTLVPQLGLLCSLAIGLAAAAPGVKTFGEESKFTTSMPI
jgi:ABC-type multidrug transport system ATPase subunit